MDIRGAIPTAGLADGVVTVEAGVITRVTAAGGAAPPPSGVIIPGLIDIHCHGGGGHSFSTRDPAEALAAAAHHAAAGTAGVIASLVSAPPDDLIGQVRALAPLVAAGHLLGIHLEGPFLSPARRGAHAPELLRDPDPPLAQALLAAARGAIKIVTIAPERPGAPVVADMFRAAGVTVAYGHTDADYALMATALASAAGSALVTHLGNAMPPLLHRAAGPVAAALVAAAAGQASVELIADGVHVDAGFTRLVFATAAPGRVVLVTDAMAAAGMPDGNYRLGPLRVTVSGGVARLAPPPGYPGDCGSGSPGAIAGGTSSLLRVVATAHAAGVPLGDAVRAASETPARVLGLAADRGGLAPGMPADLVVAGEDLAVRRVMRAGRWLARLGTRGTGNHLAGKVPYGGVISRNRRWTMAPPESDMGDTVAALVGNAWGWVLAFGLLTLAAGIAVLAWPAETLLVVAVVFGIQLVMTGVFRFVMAFSAPLRGSGIRFLYAVLGLLSLIVGLWAIRHADLTVLVLAVLLGIFWVVNGVFEIFAALSEPALEHRAWTGAMGVLSVFAGLIVIAVPGISVITLAVVLGIWLLFWGIGQIMIAFRLRSAVRAQLGPGHPARVGLWHRNAS